MASAQTILQKIYQNAIILYKETAFYKTEKYQMANVWKYLIAYNQLIDQDQLRLREIIIIKNLKLDVLH